MGSMQTEKSQPSGQWIMPETQLTSFPALSVYPRVRISLSASETDVRFYLCYVIMKFQIQTSLRVIVESLLYHKHTEKELHSILTD